MNIQKLKQRMNEESSSQYAQNKPVSVSVCNDVTYTLWWLIRVQSIYVGGAKI